jgi:DNA repair protein RadC
MYTLIASAGLKPPTRPAWLRLVRDPLSAAERGALAAQHGQLQDPDHIAALMRDRALAEEVECFYALTLDAKLRLIAIEEVARGTLISVAATPREVLRLAVVLGACGVVVAHNHPSGDPLPSPQDYEITRRLVVSGEALGIPLLDHVIIAGSPAVRADWFFSFKGHGLVGAVE